MKYVHWQIPFQSIRGTNYRIDIYDDYSGEIMPPPGWPIELQAGETPFVVSEDDSEDVFEAIRAKTGTIQVADINDNIVDIYPKNNTNKYVQLLRIDGNTSTIVEQGFLSSDSYEQSYVSVPNNFDLSYNGLLASMDSVAIDDDVVTVGFMKVRHILYHLCHMMIDKGAFIEGIYFDTESYNILDKVIDTSLLYDKIAKEDEFYTNYIFVGKSCLEAIRRIVVFMGMCVREDGTYLTFQRIGSHSESMYKILLRDLWNPETEHLTVPRYTKSLLDIERDDDWYGNEHTRNITQGAKSVEVCCNLEEYNMDSLKLPATPPINLWEGPKNTVSPSSGFGFAKLFANHGMEISNACAFSRFKVRIEESEVTNISGATEEEVYNNSVLKVGSYDVAESFTRSVGAFLANVDVYGSSKMGRISGLYMACLPSHATDINYHTSHVYSQRSVYKYTLIKGYLKLDIFINQITDSTYQLSGPVLCPFGAKTASYIPDPEVTPGTWISVRVGNKYYAGGTGTWQEEFALVGVNFENGKATNYHKPLSEEEGFFIPINDTLSGEIEVRLYPQLLGEGYTASGTPTRVVDLLVTKLEVSYSADELEGMDKKSNKYYQLLGTNFRDEIIVNSDLASYLVSDISSSSIVMNNGYNPMEELEYSSGNRKPERDLLSRMAIYYKRARYRLMLTVYPWQIGMQNGGTIANVIVEGLERNAKLYLPLATEMNYLSEQENITCYEIKDSEEND